MASRKPCVNVPTALYSGKEQSPLRFGLSAEGYDLNTVLEGYDHMLWVVKIKNNRKVWVRQTPVSGQMQMVHEEPVVMPDVATVAVAVPVPVAAAPVATAVEEVEQDVAVDVPKPEIIKAVVEEKKMTDYNLFLTYKLYELKKENNNKTNKELFNSAIAEWKELKKNPAELKKIMVQVVEFNKTYEKPETKSRKK